jgi:hypothetical protein
VSALYYEPRDSKMLRYEETDEILESLRDRSFALSAETNENAALVQYEFRYHLAIVH